LNGEGTCLDGEGTRNNRLMHLLGEKYVNVDKEDT